MITKTCSEIIKDAQYFGNVRNSDITDFYTSTVLLNNFYKELYQDIITESDMYTKEVSFSTNDFVLPKDCYQVKAIYRGEGIHKTNLSLGNSTNEIPNTYNIVNGVLHIYGSPCVGTYTVKYAPIPQTLTCPSPLKKIPNPTFQIDFSVTLLMDDEGIYVTDDHGNQHKFVFDEWEWKDGSYSPMLDYSHWDYLDGNITVDYANQTVLYTNLYSNETIDVTDYFKDRSEFSLIIADDPYCMVTYDDGTIKTFSGFESTRINYFSKNGHKTRGAVLALKTDDESGYGCLYLKDGDYNDMYLGSFVPDTVLSYPSNVLFELLSYKLGASLSSMNGVDNHYLTDVLIPKAETLFYSTVRPQREACRISNRNGVR